MHKLSNLEYSFLIRELAPKIVGKHFRRIKKISVGLYRIKIGDSEILCELGIRIHETRLLEKSELTDKFIEKVSKELDNAKLLSLEQINNDRILSFNFDKCSLIFEMFGEGNIVLVCNSNIVCAHKYESWSDREIAVGASYKPPKTMPSDNLDLSDRYVIVSLMKLPFGKEYALEVLSRAGIDEKTPGNQLTETEITKLKHELEMLKHLVKVYGFYEKGKIADFALTSLSKYAAMEKKEFATLSDAADEYYAAVEKPNPEVEKLLRRLEKQKERLVGLIEEEKMSRLKGDYIYARYVEIEHILDLAKTGKLTELEAYSVKINKKDKSIEVELE